MILKGDLVKICIPEEACKNVEINRKLAKRFNNTVGIVTKVKVFYHNATTNKVGSYCEIDGCVSDTGLPYAFDTEWVTPIGEEE